MPQRTDPKEKARELVSRYGTRGLALRFAEDTRNQHDPKHPSYDYWDRIVNQLHKNSK